MTSMESINSVAIKLKFWQRSDVCAMVCTPNHYKRMSCVRNTKTRLKHEYYAIVTLITNFDTFYAHKSKIGFHLKYNKLNLKYF